MDSESCNFVFENSRGTHNHTAQIDYVKFLNAELLTPREDEKL